jgi:iron complex outermembrane receptor protein
VYAALDLHSPVHGLTATLETIGRAGIFANDTNTQATDAYWLWNLNLGLAQQRHGWHVSEHLRVDNLADRRYVGSVIVNDGNARYFEPGPDRTLYLLLSISRSTPGRSAGSEVQVPGEARAPGVAPQTRQ